LGSSVSGAAAGGSNQNVQLTLQMSTSDVQKWLQTGTLRYNLRNPTNGLNLFGRGTS
jgi:hypothetical protein